MRTSGVLIAVMAAVVLSGCGGEAPAPVAKTETAEVGPPAPKRLPIGEITPADTPALMAAIYPDGVPPTVKDLGTFVMGERVGVLTGASNADTCATCRGSVSLFYLVRTEGGFLLQADYRDFHKSGTGGQVNRDFGVARFGGVDGGPSYAGFSDVNGETQGACTAQTITVGIFTEAGPRIALTAPFGVKKASGSVKAMVVEAAQYKADFAISYVSDVDDFVTPYLFVGQGLRPSFPAPEWTQGKC